MKKLKLKYFMPAEFLTIKKIAAEIIQYHNDMAEFNSCDKFAYQPAVKKLTQKLVIDKLTDSFCTKFTKVYFGIRNETIREDFDCEMIFAFLKRNKFITKIK